MTNGYTQGMGFVPPMSVTLDNIVTNVAASNLPSYNAATNYALNAEIIDAQRVIWRSMLDGNLGNDPATTTGKWQRIGVENRLRMFDGSLKSITENPDLIEVTITTGRVVTDVQLMGVEADSVQVLMHHQVHGMLYDSEERSMLRPSGNSHWGYFHVPLERLTKLHLWPLPAYTGGTVTIRIIRPAGVARCGEVILGRSIWLGNTYWRPALGFDDWSLKKKDEWGSWQVREGDFSERMKLQVLVEGTEYGRVRDLVVPFRAKPVLWIGARGIDGLTTLGYITSFELVPFAHGKSDCSMTIEGVEQ
ncbi:hypothetical protein PY257_16225 [Ramlibacter sp. H39-3-26]|uniref:hypothetical protein n=1 Tax=Curvibacter soli TaxID=3031331 RepID=UPI0023DAB5B3|nr:hypothetical protein [Ramlibacter sp. H39-3-26]MDF1486701.1 hypothetical protein [Ramlibacter sp. H39-3-26]